jgi:exonuclease III
MLIVNTLTILQYNVRKSKDTVMATLLRDPDIGRYDILAIQEPWKNPFDTTTHHPAKDQFHLCYPDKDRNFPARVCFFINKRLDHSRWHFREVSRDLCSLNLVLGTEEEQQIVIHNVYNPTKTATERGSTLPLLELAIERWSHHEQIIVGDFNLHHELWGGDRVQRADPDAAELTTIMEDYCLTSNLAPGTITYEERDGRTTIDLCLTTAGLVGRLIQCEIETDMDHDSDHLPITTSLDLNTVKMIAKPQRNWKALDEKTFTRVLQRELPPQRRSRTKTGLDRHVEEVMAAITAAVDEAVPKTAPSPTSKPGWNEECAAALAESKRLRRRHSLYRTEETWEAYRAARNDKGRVIKKALRQNHREKVEEAAQSPATLWRLAKWARNRHSQTPNVTPALVNPATKQQAITPSEKAELLRKTFFPVPPDTDIEDIENANYPAPAAMPLITTREIEEAIEEAAPLKAPGPDGITNKALQIASPWIKHHLTKIFNQSLTLGYYPEHFRQSTTVVLRKPGKDNYTVPKAYRPIALLNTTGKIMEAVIAKRLSYLAETHNLLPDTHMGGRKLRSTEHEEADRAAKEATGWREGDLTGPKAAEPQQLYPLRSTMKTWSLKETIMSWERDWVSETRGRASFRHTPKPSRKVLDLHDGLSKKHSALLTQLRTEKIGLKDFLYNRKVPGISSNRCPCGSDRQTVAHVLLRCRQHRQLRDQELGRLRGRNNLRKLLNERKAAAKAIKFIELTQILGQFQDRDLNRQS